MIQYFMEFSFGQSSLFPFHDEEDLWRQRKVSSWRPRNGQQL